MAFSAEASQVLTSNITFNITTPGGKILVIDNSAIIGAPIAGMKRCGQSTRVSTHVINPSAMGTGLWASNGYEGRFGGCPMSPDFSPAVHGEGSSCDGSTQIFYQNSTDGLLSLIIPGLRHGSWVVKPADDIPTDCQDELASSYRNEQLDPTSPLFGVGNGSIPLNYIFQGSNYTACANYGKYPAMYPNGTAVLPDNYYPGGQNVTDVIIEYTGPTARILPDQILNSYAQLQDCIARCNVPGDLGACFDPGLSRASSNACLHTGCATPATVVCRTRRAVTTMQSYVRLQNSSNKPHFRSCRRQQRQLFQTFSDHPRHMQH